MTADTVRPTVAFAADTLSGVDVFVGGPIQHALSGKSLDSSLSVRLKSVIGAVRDRGGTVFSAHVAEQFGVITDIFTPEQVSVRDYRWMQKCDVFVPVLPCDESGDLMRTDGTHIELGWASATGMPIVMVIDTPLPASASHLLKGLPQVGRVRIVDLGSVATDPVGLIAAIADATAVQRHMHRVVAG